MQQCVISRVERIVFKTGFEHAAAFWVDPNGPHLPTAYTICPGDLYFRKVFTRARTNRASDVTPTEKE